MSNTKEPSLAGITNLALVKQERVRFKTGLCQFLCNVKTQAELDDYTRYLNHLTLLEQSLEDRIIQMEVRD